MPEAHSKVPYSAERSATGRYLRLACVVSGLMSSCVAYAADSCLQINGHVKDSFTVPAGMHSARASQNLYGASTLFNTDDDKFWNSLGSENLKNAGITALRFPGGEVADNYDWETSSVLRPSEWPKEAKTAKLKAERTDYLEFLATAKRLGVKNIFFVVNIDSALRENGGLEKNLQKYADKAARWVAAVKSAGYHVPYWEIGNEPYLKSNSFTAEEYAQVLNAYAKAMRAADPTIKIGAAGPSGAREIRLEAYSPSGKNKKSEALAKWWPTLLAEARDSFDFVVIHKYGMPQWPQGKKAFHRTTSLRNFKEKLDAAKGGVVPLALTEWNIKRDPESRMPAMQRLLEIAIHFGNNAAGGVDYALYWPMRTDQRGWESLIAPDSSLSTAGQLLSLANQITADQPVAEAALSPSLYLLNTGDTATHHAMVVNKGSKAVDVHFRFNKSGEVKVSRFTQQQNGKPQETTCTASVKKASDQTVGIEPRSVVIIHAKN
ncbi:hypothetical protein GG851_25565 [Bordetella petrii]|nr:hypothetical protein [Bordetella petrii]